MRDSRGFRSVLTVAVVAATVATLVVPGPIGPAPAAAQTTSQLLRLLAYAPEGSDYVNYSNLADFKRLTGPHVASIRDIPAPPADSDRPLTPAQQVGKAWSWEIGRQIPASDFLGLQYARLDTWDRSFGFDVFKVDYELEVGLPPKRFSVIEGAIDAATSGARLTAIGYAAESSALGPDSTLYTRFDDYEIQVGDDLIRVVLAKFNRVLVSPGQIIAGAATSLVAGAVEAATGQRRSLAMDPDVALVAATMDDPDLLPDTTLLGATLLTGSQLGLVGVDVAGLLEATRLSPEQVERIRQQLREAPVLPPYRMIGLGYRRGGDFAQRYWLFTLLYDDEEVAGTAAGVLEARIGQYHSVRTRQPLVGTYIEELLPPLIRSSEAGTTLSLLLRVKEDRPAGWLELLSQRDLGFLAAGPMLGP